MINYNRLIIGGLKMTYLVQVSKENTDWNEVEPINITHYPWGTDYIPCTNAWLYRIENKGFYLKMRCEETAPRAVYTEDNDPVYKDSCMEFFVNFFPEEEGSGYLNFEMNSNGAILCEYGHPGNRFYLKDKGINYPHPRVTKGDDFWEIELLITDELIETIYGQSHFKKGHQFKGNFYKCGDDTHTPHYGSWSLIKNEYPAFHKPEFFGNLEIC